MSNALKKGSWTAKTEQLPLSQIDKDEANRKTLTNLDKLEADMARANGLYYPIIVSPYVTTEKGVLVGEEAIKHWKNKQIAMSLRRFMIFDGERRFVVATRLGWTTIPALIRLKENLMELHELQLASNAKREDMNPVDMAQAIDRYIKEYTEATGLSRMIAVKRICKLTDWSQTYVEARLDILKMPESVQNDIRLGYARANMPTEILHNIPTRYQPDYIQRAERREMQNVLETRVVGKQLDLIADMPVPIEQQDAMSKAVINRGGRFAYGEIDAKPDFDAYDFEVRSWRERVSCWNITGDKGREHIKRLENLASGLNDILMLFRNMQKEELGISRVGELKEKQWHDVKKP